MTLKYYCFIVSLKCLLKSLIMRNKTIQEPLTMIKLRMIMQYAKRTENINNNCKNINIYLFGYMN